MKKVLFSLVAVAMMAGAANAAVISLGNVDNTTPGYATIDVVLDLMAGETTPGVGIAYGATGPGPLAWEGSVAGSTLDNDVSIPGDFYIAYNTPGGAAPLVGPGTFTVASFTVSGVAGDYEMMMSHESTSILKPDGSPMGYAPMLVDMDLPHLLQVWCWWPRCYRNWFTGSQSAGLHHRS